MTFLHAILCIIGGAFVLFIGGIAAGLCVAASKPAPKPHFTGGQIEWFAAQAKVAHRRAS